MEAKSIVVYTLGGLFLATGVGVGIYFITRKPKVSSTIKTSTSGSAPNNGGSGNQQPNQSTGDNISSGGDTTTGAPIVGDTPEQVRYDIINYGDHLPAGSFPLVVGSKNKLVWDIQKALNTNFGTNLVTDGSMGEETLKAICSKAFRFCFSAFLKYRDLKLQKSHYDDILAGKINTDIVLTIS